MTNALDYPFFFVFFSFLTLVLSKPNWLGRSPRSHEDESVFDLVTSFFSHLPFLFSRSAPSLPPHSPLS